MLEKEDLKVARFCAYVRAVIGDQSHREFARKVGVSQPVISSWMKGDIKRLPNTDTLQSLAAASGLTQAKLMGILNGQEEAVDEYEYLKWVVGSLDFERASEISFIASKRVKDLVETGIKATR